MINVLEKLQQAKRPLILAGHGIRCAGQVDLFRDLISALNIPLVTTQLARDLMPAEHRLYVGSPGVKGDRAGGLAVQSCDLLLILGCSLHVTTTGYELKQFAPQAYKIWVDLDIKVLSKPEIPVQYSVLSSVQEFLSFLVENPFHHASNEWHQQCQDLKHRFDLRNEKREISACLDIYEVIETLSLIAGENDTIVADAGSAFYITGQAWRTKSQQRVILPGALAHMGYTTGAMIGASFADPNTRVIGITGDGSLQTNIHDLGVLSCHQLNAKLIVLNNAGYACIRNTQDTYFGGHHSGSSRETGVLIPNLKMIAESYYLRYLCIHDRSELKRRLEFALLNKDPYVIEIYTQTKQEIIPRVQSQRMPDGSMSSKGLGEMYPYSL